MRKTYLEAIFYDRENPSLLLDQELMDRGFEFFHVHQLNNI